MGKMLYLPAVNVAPRAGEREHDLAFDDTAYEREYRRRELQVRTDVVREAAARGAVLARVEVEAEVRRRLREDYR